MSKESERRRQKLEKDADRLEEERRRELFRRRLEIAKNGLKSFQLHRISEAAQAFHIYIKVLEDWKRVGEGELNPTLFDKKNEASELLLVTGVYWDLAKMYDRTKSDKRQKEFQHYLDKYVAFSKGMPYQQLSLETLRKYLMKNEPNHLEAFRRAFTELGGGKCFVATSLLDVTDENTMQILRKWRDQKLRPYKLGRMAIQTYYLYSPKAVLWLDRSPQWIRKFSGYALDFFAQAISKASRFSRDENNTGSRKN